MAVVLVRVHGPLAILVLFCIAKFSRHLREVCSYEPSVKNYEIFLKLGSLFIAWMSNSFVPLTRVVGGSRTTGVCRQYLTALSM